MSAVKLGELCSLIDAVRKPLIELLTLERYLTRPTPAGKMVALRSAVVTGCSAARDAAGPWLLVAAKELDWPVAGKWFHGLRSALSPSHHFDTVTTWDALFGRYFPEVTEVGHLLTAEPPPGPSRTTLEGTATIDTTPSTPGLAIEGKPGRPRKGVSTEETAFLDAYWVTKEARRNPDIIALAELHGLSFEQAKTLIDRDRKRRCRANGKSDEEKPTA